MTTELWVPTYQQYHFDDGSWVNFMKGLYDERDIMSDVTRPQYCRTGEYRIELVSKDCIHNSDVDFIVTVDTAWANKVFYNLTTLKAFSTMDKLKRAFQLEGLKRGTYKHFGTNTYITLKG